jgi:alkylation response protein AidB-like acyl-CoA dehydrogenase
MIDFRLTERDKAALAKTRAEALICREHARYYDENESEMAPDELPEAAEFYKNYPAVPEADLATDTTGPVMMMMQTIGNFWGDYTVRLQKAGSGGLGNAALAAAGTPEQNEKWRGLVLAMAITEPGCGSDPSRVSTSAVLD